MITKEQAIGILDKFDFFQGQDIANFKKDVDSLAEYLINTDVVEVVRCRDCKHRHVPHRCALWYGTLGDNEYFCERGADFFCSYGERKDGD